jgi:hypothetical protein
VNRLSGKHNNTSRQSRRTTAPIHIYDYLTAKYRMEGRNELAVDTVA